MAITIMIKFRETFVEGRGGLHKSNKIFYETFFTSNYRVSLKERYFSNLCLISVLEVRFCFFTRVLESKF